VEPRSKLGESAKHVGRHGGLDRFR
jgi:hypothetical protein